MATCPVHGRVKKIGSFYLSEIGRPLREGHDDFIVQYSCEGEYISHMGIGWSHQDEEYIRVI